MKKLATLIVIFIFAFSLAASGESREYHLDTPPQSY